MERVITLINKLKDLVDQQAEIEKLELTTQLLLSELRFNGVEPQQKGNVSIWLPPVVFNTSVNRSFFMQVEAADEKETETENPAAQAKIVELTPEYPVPALIHKELIPKIQFDHVLIEKVLTEEGQVEEKLIDEVQMKEESIKEGLIGQEQTAQEKIEKEQIEKELYQLNVDPKDFQPDESPEANLMNEGRHMMEQLIAEVPKVETKKWERPVQEKEVADMQEEMPEYPEAEAPVRDLQTGISLKDRCLFTHLLFRDDESMYERSIRTINNFNYYSEAQYWIQRELGLRMGWEKNQETARYFDQIIRRRFA